MTEIINKNLRESIGRTSGIGKSSKLRRYATADADEAITFSNRALTSLAADDDPRGKKDILVAQGIPADAIIIDGGNLKINTVDGLVDYDEKQLSLYDVADWIGEIPAIVGGTIGGVLGASAGPVGGIVGASSGSALGDAARQGLASLAGSKQDYDYGQTAFEGALGATGELGQRAITGLIKGPGRRLAGKESPSELMGKVKEVDKSLGTNLEQKAPISVQTESPVIGSIEARQQQNIVTRGRMKDKMSDLLSETEKGFNVLTNKLKLGERNNPDEVGKIITDGFESTKIKRLGTRTKLYDDFKSNVDPIMGALDKSNLQSLIDSAPMQQALGRKSATAGLSDLKNIVRDVSNIRNYTDLENARQEAFELISKDNDLPRYVAGIKGQLESLHRALQVADDLYLSQGGGIRPASDLALTTGKKAKAYNVDFMKTQESPALMKLLGDSQKAKEVGKSIKLLSPNEIKAIKEGLGVSPTKRGSETILESTPEGEEAYQILLNEVLSEIRDSALFKTKGKGQGRFPDDLRRVVSGSKLENALDGFKRGSLQELFGEEFTSELYRFANVAADLTETGLQNFSNTEAMSQTGRYIDDIVDIFSSAISPEIKTSQALRQLLSRITVDVGVGRAITNPAMGRYLLGKTKFQEALPGGNFLGTLGRGASQVGVKSLQEDRRQQ